MAATVVTPATLISSTTSSSSSYRNLKIEGEVGCRASALQFCSSPPNPKPATFTTNSKPRHAFCVVACLPSPPKTTFNASTKLYVSGLSFRTTEESLRYAFKNFGELTEVNLVMDRVAKRPRGFAFLCYETEEESKKAIEGMHGKSRARCLLLFVSFSMEGLYLLKLQNQDLNIAKAGHKTHDKTDELAI